MSSYHILPNVTQIVPRSACMQLPYMPSSSSKYKRNYTSLHFSSGYSQKKKSSMSSSYSSQLMLFNSCATNTCRSYLPRKGFYPGKVIQKRCVTVLGKLTHSIMSPPTVMHKLLRLNTSPGMLKIKRGQLLRSRFNLKKRIICFVRQI
jgi:hypothetical protein